MARTVIVAPDLLPKIYRTVRKKFELPGAPDLLHEKKKRCIIIAGILEMSAHEEVEAMLAGKSPLVFLNLFPGLALHPEYPLLKSLKEEVGREHRLISQSIVRVACISRANTFHIAIGRSGCLEIDERLYKCFYQDKLLSNAITVGVPIAYLERLSVLPTFDPT